MPNKGVTRHKRAACYTQTKRGKFDGLCFLKAATIRFILGSKVSTSLALLVIFFPREVWWDARRTELREQASIHFRAFAAFVGRRGTFAVHFS